MLNVLKRVFALSKTFIEKGPDEVSKIRVRKETLRSKRKIKEDIDLACYLEKDFSQCAIIRCMGCPVNFFDKPIMTKSPKPKINS